MKTGSSEFPLVSAIVPTFNRSQLLVRAIDSILKQSYPNIEIIIVDDGSTDDTEIMVAEIAKRASQLIYLKKENGGCASARNKGLESARGDFIAFLDSDDSWEQEAIESLIGKLLDSGAELAYSPSIEMYLSGREETNYPVAAERVEMLAREHFMNTNVRNGSYMFRRSAFEKVGGLNENLRCNEDSDFFQRLAIQCSAVYSPSPTVRVYNHSGSKSRNRIEIYRALLKSSQLILAAHPGFAAGLGAGAEKRISQIKAQLIEALVLDGRFDEANLFAKDVFHHLRSSVKFALRSRTRLVLKIDGSLSKIMNRFMKIRMK